MGMDLDDHGNMTFFFPLKVETILMLQIPNTKEGLVVPCRNTFASGFTVLEKLFSHSNIYVIHIVNTSALKLVGPEIASVHHIID